MDICKRCGRKLTSVRSRKLGFGEECWRRMRAAVAVLRLEAQENKIGAFRPHQIDSALELVVDGGIAHIGDYVFETVSSNGLERYATTLFECTCLSGERGESCYHQAAVLVFGAVI